MDNQRHLAGADGRDSASHACVGFGARIPGVVLDDPVPLHQQSQSAGGLA
jgi:hypothetical protein